MYAMTLLRRNTLVVRIYRRYFDLISSPRIKQVAFYFHPFPNKFEFKNSPVGIHYLNEILPKLCESIGTKRKTSHSLRVTCVSTLFTSSVEEKLIRDRSGHVSNALQCYEKSISKQEIQVSNLLNPPENAEAKIDIVEDIELPNFSFDDLDSMILMIIV